MNILISESLEEIKLIDFGVSKFTNGGMITPTGNPSYRAPEINLGALYTEKVDIWSIGQIFYELLNREPITSKK